MKYLLLFLGVFLFAPHVFAAPFDAMEDFDSYTSGNTINGQTAGTGWTGGWVASNEEANNSTSLSSPNSLLIYSDVVSGDGTRTMDPADSGSICFGVEADNLPTGTKGFIPGILYEGSSLKWRVDWGSGTGGSGNTLAFGNGSTEATLSTSITANSWHTVCIEIDQPTNSARATLDGGTPTSWVLANGGGFTNIDKFRFTGADGNATDQGYHIDSIGESAPPPPPPGSTGDYNELLNFIPSQNVSTSTGVTTVGGHYSIAEPTWINYFEYILIAPDGSIVYDASSTATSSGLYDITTDYNFTKVGFYQGFASFNQTIGSSTVNTQVGSPQQIGIGITGLTVNDNGNFNDLPGITSTTSTTTLNNLSLDCGAGFAGSICNAAALLIIPSAASIQAVQSAFSLVLSKAPFSFMVETRNALAAFNTSSSSAAVGTLSLHFYSQNVPIISSTTAASVGLTSSMIDFLKTLEIAGLWILLAWFVYWRVATTFHLST